MSRQRCVGHYSPITLLLPHSVPNTDEDSEELKRADSLDAVDCGHRTQNTEHRTQKKKKVVGENLDLC